MHPTISTLINSLNLEPHPEGGYFRETYRAPQTTELSDGRNRHLSTAIYFLIPEGVTTAWHCVSSDEMWHFYDGSPLHLELADSAHPDDSDIRRITLGTDFEYNQEPQFNIPAGKWQRAASTGLYTLVGCTVTPGFDFQDFKLAKEE